MTRINNKGLCRPRYLRLKDGLMGKVLPECGRDFCRVNEGKGEEGFAGGETGNANVYEDSACNISVPKFVNME